MFSKMDPIIKTARGLITLPDNERTVRALVILLTPVNHDVIVEEAQGVVVQLILDTLLTEMFHWVAIRAGASPSLSPLRIARR